MMFRIALVLALGLGTCSADTGGCLKIQPETNVELDKLLGTWYSIQQTDGSAPCLRYNLTKNEKEPGHYRITETRSSSGFIDTIGFHHESEKSGDVTIPDPKEPGVLHLDVPLDIGNYKITIFMTDYDNYLALFSCRTLPLTKSIFHTWSALILSRERILKVEYIEKARARLAAYNVDPFLLEISDQSDCAEAGSKGVFVQAASGVFDVIKDTVGNVAQNVIHKVSDVVSKVGGDSN